MGVGSLEFCQRGQGWWRSRDWASCMIEKLGGTGGGRKKWEECQKKCVSHEMQQKHLLTILWRILDSVALLV